MRDITVLFTACCGWPTCGTIDSLKRGGKNRYRIVGCDCSTFGAALNYVDALYEVPVATDPAYIDSLIGICEAEKVDVLVPLVSDELPIIHRNLHRFAELGVAVNITGKDGMLETATNKYRLYTFLEQCGVHAMPRTFDLDPATVEEDLEALGYPGPVCVKMKDGCGSIAFKIIDDEKSNGCMFMPTRASRNNPYITKRQFMEVLPTMGDRFMLQEYVEGTEQCVMCLVDRGEVLYAIATRNAAMANSSAVNFEIVKDEEAFRVARTICKLLNLDGNIGFDFIRTEKGLRLFEINPRITASISSAEKAGLNLVEMGVLHALGEPIEQDIEPLWGLKVKKVYQSLYEYEGKPYGR